jgi:hypothetical protein
VSQQGSVEALAGRVKAALESADVARIGELLGDGVRWGAPDDPAPPCQNRDQVLRWYERGREAGVRAEVFETVAHGDKILVGLRVHGSLDAAAPGPEHDRWQVLTVERDRVVDIRGFDDRDEAARRVGLDG